MCIYEIEPTTPNTRNKMLKDGNGHQRCYNKIQQAVQNVSLIYISETITIFS